MKTLRFLLEVMLFIVLFPVIVLIELAWLIFCIRTAMKLNQSIMKGVKTWVYYLKAGLEMNKDFVLNGL